MSIEFSLNIIMKFVSTNIIKGVSSRKVLFPSKSAAFPLHLIPISLITRYTTIIQFFIMYYSHSLTMDKPDFVLQETNRRKTYMQVLKV